MYTYMFYMLCIYIYMIYIYTYRWVSRKRQAREGNALCFPTARVSQGLRKLP